MHSFQFHVATILILIYSCFQLTGFSQNQETSIYIPDSITVDGRHQDWPEPIFQVEKKNISYVIANNATHVFVRLVIPDEQVQNQIFLTGLTLWIDPKGKKKQSRGVRFPTGLPSESLPNDPSVLTLALRQIQDTKSEKAKAMASLELIGFYGKDDITWGSNQNPGGINAMITIDPQGVMLYEAAIPLDVYQKDLQPFFAPKPQRLSIGLETGRLGRPSLMGQDAVGISGGSISNPRRVESQGDRRRQDQLEFYSTYATPTGFWIKKISLSAPN